jgi:hypothetical protein
VNLCREHDDDLAYEGRECPACALAQQVEQKEITIAGLQERIEDLEDQLVDAQAQLA